MDNIVSQITKITGEMDQAVKDMKLKKAKIAAQIADENKQLEKKRATIQAQLDVIIKSRSTKISKKLAQEVQAVMKPNEEIKGFECK